MDSQELHIIAVNKKGFVEWYYNKQHLNSNERIFTPSYHHQNHSSFTKYLKRFMLPKNLENEKKHSSVLKIF